PNSIRPKQMAKGYWITFYHAVRDPARLAEYGALATPAIEAGGGRFLSRGPAARTFEGVEKQRTGLVEFDSGARPSRTYQSPRDPDPHARHLESLPRPHPPPRGLALCSS